MRALSSHGSASLLLITVPPPWESWKPICIPSGGKRSGFYIPTFQHSFSTFYKGSRDWLWSCWAGNAAGAVQAKTWSGRFCVLRQAAGGWWHVDRRPKVFTNVSYNNCHLFNGFWVSFLFSIIYSCWCFDGDVATLYRYDGMWINGAAYYTEYPS